MLLMRMIQAVDACERENSSRCCGGDGCHDKKGDKRGCSRSYMMGGSILAVTTSDAARHRPCTPPFCTSRTEFIHVDGMNLGCDFVRSTLTTLPIKCILEFSEW